MSYVSKFALLNIPIPGAASVGITEDITYVNKIEVLRTVNGDALVVTSPFDRKCRFAIKATGLAIRAEPALMGIHLGGYLTINSSVYQSFRIPAGAPSLTLDHQVVFGSRFLCDRRDHPEPVSVNVDGNIVTVVGGPVPFDVLFRVRLVYDVVLAGQNKGANEVEGTQTWSADFEEA